jgi:hypothetical protein
VNIIKFSELNDVASLQRELHSGHSLSLYLYASLIRAALKASSFAALKILKPYVSKYLMQHQREPLIVEFFQLPYPVRIAWILGNFELGRVPAKESNYRIV